MSNSAFLNIDLKPIRDLLGPSVTLPDLPPGPLGRFRLVQTLQNRFGNDFRSIGPAREALKHFDKETAHVKGFVEAKLFIGGKNG